jgi:hypothetical protein
MHGPGNFRLSIFINSGKRKNRRFFSAPRMNNSSQAGPASNCGLADKPRPFDAPQPAGAQSSAASSQRTLRLAGAAPTAHRGATEAADDHGAILDSLARQEDALGAVGKLLVALANNAAAQPATYKRLIELETSCALRLERLEQIEVLRSWNEELAKPRHADPRRLVRYGFKVYSQCDEDGIIQEIFRRIGTTNRTFVEFGIEAGIEGNSVKLLIEGWRGLWLDGVDQHISQIHKRFKTFVESRHLAASQAFITAENINSLIAQGGVTGEIDLLSVDIDHNDYWVWQAIDVVNPRVVVIEYNATLHPPLSLVVPYEPNRTWDGSNFYGASLEALVRLGRNKGYQLVGCNFAGTNAFFVRNDLVGDLFLNPPTAEEHYEPPRYYFGMLTAGHRPSPGPYVAV